jgi:transketolase
MSETQEKLKYLKRLIIMATLSEREGHIPSAFSILDILWVLYDRIMKINPAFPQDPYRDRFILSKGHGSLALYAVLGEKGFFPINELDTFAKYDSRLGGHPDCNKIPGVEASTGSLGHGLPIGVGMALGMKIRNNGRRVYVLVGDAECNEGSIWEAVLLAAHHKLSNITCVVDYNHSTDRALTLGNLEEKFASFGWSTSSVDGHDHNALFAALTKAANDRPTAIIAETIKGFGCKKIENNPAWHHRVANDDELPEILGELV